MMFRNNNMQEINVNLLVGYLLEGTILILSRFMATPLKLKIILRKICCFLQMLVLKQQKPKNST